MWEGRGLEWVKGGRKIFSHIYIAHNNTHVQQRTWDMRARRALAVCVTACCCARVSASVISCMIDTCSFSASRPCFLYKHLYRYVHQHTYVRTWARTYARLLIYLHARVHVRAHARVLTFFVQTCVWFVRVCVCECVWKRETKREREKHVHTHARTHIAKYQIEPPVFGEEESQTLAPLIFFPCSFWRLPTPFSPTHPGILGEHASHPPSRYWHRLIAVKSASWHTYQRVASHVSTSCVTRINEICHTYPGVTSHIWIVYVTHMNKSCHTYQ